MDWGRSGEGAEGRETPFCFLFFCDWYWRGVEKGEIGRENLAGGFNLKALGGGIVSCFVFLVWSYAGEVLMNASYRHPARFKKIVG